MNSKRSVTRLYPLLSLLLVILWGCGPGRHAVSRGHKYENRQTATSNPPKNNEASENKQNEQKKSNEKISGNANEIINEAYTWLGTPYKYGKNSRQGTDCSGFVMEVYSNAIGLKLPRSSREQHDYCRIISFDSLQPGDLVFFASTPKSAISHVGIYIGNDEMIHASVSRGVMVSNLYEPYFQQHFHSAGRVGDLKPAADKAKTILNSPNPQITSKNSETKGYPRPKDYIEVSGDSISTFLSNFMD
ncbi:MAG: C40 family peptidase [Muribaculaceae bacterium]|nr:C40 family peptidase [Muribaculaceae bacterium]